MWKGAAQRRLLPRGVMDDLRSSAAGFAGAVLHGRHGVRRGFHIQLTGGVHSSPYVHAAADGLNGAILTGRNDAAARGKRQGTVCIFDQRTPHHRAVRDREPGDERFAGDIPFRAILHDNRDRRGAVVVELVLHMALEEVLVNGIGPDLDIRGLSLVRCLIALGIQQDIADIVAVPGNAFQSLRAVRNALNGGGQGDIAVQDCAFAQRYGQIVAALAVVTCTVVDIAIITPPRPEA